MIILPYLPNLGPSTKVAANAAAPPHKWTTPEPAKSTNPYYASHPPLQTQ